MQIVPATFPDLPAILALQYLAFQSEAVLLQNFSIPPLLQTLESVQLEFENGLILKTVEDGAIIGSVRGFVEGNTLFIGKLIVHPNHQGKGIGTMLLRAMETAYPELRCELFTSSKCEKNIRLYERMGYTRFAQKQVAPDLSFVYLEKAPAIRA